MFTYSEDRSYLDTMSDPYQRHSVQGDPICRFGTDRFLHLMVTGLGTKHDSISDFRVLYFRNNRVKARRIDRSRCVGMKIMSGQTKRSAGRRGRVFGEKELFFSELV